MALFTEKNIRARAHQEMQLRENHYKSKSQVLNESAISFNKFRTYDIFLSHSSQDSELILGVKTTLEDLGYSVYVDWIDDTQLNRSNVNEDTAKLLRERMNSSRSLFYVTTENSVTSKWMPWECGYFDGLKEKVAILPIKKYSYNNEYQGQEYLSLYPYCLKENNIQEKERLWIHKSEEYYLTYEAWLATQRDSIKWKKI
ncbi:toll/interleukin-1 receptor domain-containing protein [Proteus cibarius]|uniref:toll/interleukin-1 receptor domain-containing protein n=1 Tax=Proteus terrae TaxID=1574161 RepID=UPI0018C6AF00|nr:TIR domain-containing protein [Proteus terrae]MBG3090657.1 toll/interleukin-1 receptor domain-containing protein [Proteus terrae subsp. cibarius]